MMRRLRERGEGQLGCIIGLLVFLSALFIAYKMIPVKVRAAELRQEVVDEAKAAGMRRGGEITANILRRAEELDLPLSKEDIVIAKSSGMIRIDVSYTVPVEFPGGYVYQWNFNHRAENPIF